MLKKKYLVSALSVAIAIPAIAAQNYVVVVDSNDVDYEVGGFSDSVEYSEWVFSHETNCSFDKDPTEFYKNISFQKVETCENVENRTKTTTRTYNNGTEEVISVEEETQIVLGEAKDPVNDIGTHVESSCKGVKEFDSSLDTGVYRISLSGTEFDAHCEMGEFGGGWTLVFKNYGGPGSTGIGTPTLLSDSSHIATLPNKVNGSTLASQKNNTLYSHYKNMTNVELLKVVRAYENSTGNEKSPFISDHSIAVPMISKIDLGSNVQFNTIINANDDITLNNKVHLIINGGDHGQTNKIFHNSASVGLANKENGDDFGLPDDNLTTGWASRHIFYYTRDSGMNAVRCQPTCWSGSENYKIESLWYFREK
jgi:hypothetical protein